MGLKKLPEIINKKNLQKKLFSKILLYTVITNSFSFLLCQVYAHFNFFEIE